MQAPGNELHITVKIMGERTQRHQALLSRVKPTKEPFATSFIRFLFFSIKSDPLKDKKVVP